MAYYIGIFSRMARYRPMANGQGTPPLVSVVICAHNEAQNLTNYLPKVLQQDYPSFQVIVVDDHSTDSTAEVLEKFQEQNPHLSLIFLSGAKPLPGKRGALLEGIDAAYSDIIVLTDADCYPESPQWLQHMVAPFHNPQTEIVLGYGAYEQQKGWLNKMIQYDTFLTAMQYFSWALIGRPYMGVGRNLAYRKTLFAQHKSILRNPNTLGGDDDLFINQAANRHNTAICLQPGAATISKPKTTFGGWVQQKWRHANAGHQYKTADKASLGLFLMAMVLFHVSFMVLLLKFALLPFILTFFMLKTVIQLLIYKPSMNKFKIAGLWACTPLLDFCMSYFLISLGCLSVIKKKEWTK